MSVGLVVRIAAVALAAALFLVPAGASAAKKNKKDKPLVVCKHGCKYRTIQKAVDKAGKGDTIKVKPGKYVEGVYITGKKYKGLTITGTPAKKAKKVIIEGKNAQSGDGSGVANNGIEVRNVNKVTVKNVLVRNFANNGIFFYDSNTANKKITCNDFLAKNTYTAFNRSYGVYAFGCAGGKITQSEGWGHGDSAFYIGATPFPQKNPKKTVLDKNKAYKNVLGYSGTNSHYVDIKNSDYYNNGAGIVPNTLDSEPFEPTSDSVIRNNNVFWNNFNYFLPNSGVNTVSDGLGEIEGLGTLQYPTGAGVILFGGQNWKVENNNIFGNFKWGVAMFSDPFNEGGDALSKDNQIKGNEMGRDGTDTNAVDFWNDGSGSGNCWSGNNSSTFAPTGDASATIEQLYPTTCPAPVVAPNPGATGTSVGNGNMVGQLLNYVLSNDAKPPEAQECSWVQHSHPKFKKYKAVDIKPDPQCN